jgi:hypothetical protein
MVVDIYPEWKTITISDEGDEITVTIDDMVLLLKLKKTLLFKDPRIIDDIVKWIKYGISNKIFR